MNLTARQQQVLDCVRAHLERCGSPPTRAEIAAELGFRSLNAAESHLQALARKGALSLVAGSARGIRLAAPPPGVPVIGRVAAGHPILAEAHIERYCPLDRRLFHPAVDYLLRVEGTSMVECGILDGDLLAVHKTAEARNGQIVVARLGDEVTVKRFYVRGRRIELCPENPEFSPISVDPKRQAFAIEGLGVGVLRASL